MSNDTFTCPGCGRTSHNPNDAREGYCSACHAFADDTSIGAAIRGWYAAAMKVAIQAEADALFSRLVERGMATGLGRARAEEVVRENIGYQAVGYDNETRARVERLFRCEHPWLGSIEKTGPLTEEQVYRLGLERGKALRARAGLPPADDERRGGAERHFGQRGGGSPTDYGISSARLTRVGGHDRLRVWNRGAPAGELVLAAGDGEMLALALGLVEGEREPGSVGDLYRCPKCKRETPHVHEHDAAHGIAETHMGGTERYRCLECSWASYANEMHDGRMFFELDRPKEPA